MMNLGRLYVAQQDGFSVPCLWRNQEYQAETQRAFGRSSRSARAVKTLVKHNMKQLQVATKVKPLRKIVT
jgi:hypothetical protein